MRTFLFLLFFYITIIVVSAGVMAQDTRAAILAGGCFWCVEHDLKSLNGVTDVVSGYAGGDRPNPTYGNYHDVDG